MKKLNSSEIVLILANCVPLAGVLFFDWSLFSLLISFWLETGVLLIFVFIKTLYLYKSTSETALLFNGFATFLFLGGFMFSQLIGIMALFSIVPRGDVWAVLNLFRQSSTQLLIMFITLLISHGYSFLYNFIGKNEEILIVELIKQFGVNSPKVGEMVKGDLFTRIFFRVFFTQSIIIIGALIIALTKSTIYLSAIFIIVKTIIDLIFHRKKHKINNNLLTKVN